MGGFCNYEELASFETHRGNRVVLSHGVAADETKRDMGVFISESYKKKDGETVFKRAVSGLNGEDMTKLYTCVRIACDKLGYDVEDWTD